MENCIVEKLEWLAQFGKDSQNGITRLVYSEAWCQAQRALKSWLEEEGFTVEIDEVGNVLAKVEGTESPDEVVMTGSHLDTVVHGGIYDGQYGIIGGAIAILELIKEYGPPKRSLQLVAFAEEEGSRFPYAMWGSKSMFGKAGIEDIEDITDSNGRSMKSVMKTLGYTGVQEPAGNVEAFIELHIEQGNVLEKEAKDVGIVHSIVGQRRLCVTVIGEANHAGTTPMGYRKDAMKAASSMIHRVLTIAEETGDPLVTTVGTLSLEPNISNVVPGKAIFTVDVRHIDEGILSSVTELMVEEMKSISKRSSVEVEIETWFSSEPIKMNDEMIRIMTESCERNNVLFKHMHSGAAHDAQVVATAVPSAMLFVPSTLGISHSPLEYTSEHALNIGVDILKDTLRTLAY